MPFEAETVNIDQENLTSTESEKEESVNSDETIDSDNTETNEEETQTETDEQLEKSEHDEEYVDDEDYLRSFYEKGLPPEIKTLEDAIQYGIDSSKQTNTNSADLTKLNQVNAFLVGQGLNGGVDALLAGGQVPQSQTNQFGFNQTQGNNQSVTQEQSIFPESPYSQIVEEAIRIAADICIYTNTEIFVESL